MAVTAHSSIDFHHPYHPYDIQIQFMNALYECIEQRKVGIFESPTGTGKSLSLICASLTWLRDHKRKAFEESLADETGGDEPEWMRAHAREERKRQLFQQRIDLEAQLDAVRQKERKVRARFENGEPQRKRQKLAGSTNAAADDEDQFVLDDYQSDAESSKKPGDPVLSTETQALMRKLGLLPAAGAGTTEELGEVEDELKVFFCSRTHSQLSQFVGELRRVKLPSSIPAEKTDTRARSDPNPEFRIEELKHISLGSRKNLCINEKVASLKSPTAINERCLELQETKTPMESRCQYLPKKESEALLLDFQHHALARIRDIEDLGTLGKKIGICPYYASRPVVRPSEIVTAPYPLLLQRSAREALDLSVKDHVVIIDEAHNLMDAILGIYTTEVSLAQLQRGREQLTTYLQKFRNRLKGKNRVYVTQVVRLVDSLIAFLQSMNGSKANSSRTVQATELLAGKGVDQINLYQLMHYLQESKLARKVEGYASYATQHAETFKHGHHGTVGQVSIPVITHIQGFFLALTNPSAEGRFFCSTSGIPAESTIKYLLLDPSEHFRQIVEDARAVILAGGTMSPMDDYLQQLFPHLPASRIMTMSCGHVIPASNLFVGPVVQASNGSALDFTFASRETSTTVTSLGQTLLRVLPHVPDGMVVFFPSYAYLNQIAGKWKLSSAGQRSMWSQMEERKPIFMESQSGSSEMSVDDMLRDYAAAINSNSGRGALLLSIIGGKLSEGINFSDRLGRCVIVVGLPYPNPHSPEWKAKMEYIEQRAVARGVAPGTASREFAENVCMRAVNQAIGRAVRHKDDWAAILLIDGRYEQKRILDKLPKWIQASLPETRSSGFGMVESGLRTFFDKKRHDGGDRK